MLSIASDAVELMVDPWMGGGICAFTWRGIDIFRPFRPSGRELDLASFPLVPFCNRIAEGSIVYRAKPWTLPPAPAATEPVHALHGVGWRSPWATIEAGADLIRLGLRHDGALWPWPFVAEQRFEVSQKGFTYSLSLTNHDTIAMPAGLGLHPYFPRDRAVLELDAHARWEVGEDRLPRARRELAKSPDWLSGEELDHCFECAPAPFTVRWPTHRLRVSPSKSLAFTHVYTPQGADFFCVEPVSHIPNAVHCGLDRATTGLEMLGPGETMEVQCQFEVEEAN